MPAQRLLWVPIACIMAVIVVGCVSNEESVQHDSEFYRLAEMDSASIRALNASRTLFILPLDPLEAHGPHLPIATDVFSTDEITRRTVRRVHESRPDWSVVIMPTVSYGVSGANRIADRSDIRGTFSVRATTLRSVVADVASQVAEHGIRWLFVAYIHGAADHHAALNDAADFVRDTYRISIVNLGAIEWYLPHPKRDEFLQAHFTSEQRARIGFDIHAGMRETSRILAIRPDLVAESVRQLPDRTVADWAALEAFGHDPRFEGYWSAPAPVQTSGTSCSMRKHRFGLI